MGRRAQDEIAARGITVDFDGLRALENVDLDLARGEVLGLIGPNGAGKTTFLNVLTGFQPPTSGSVCLRGTDITRWAPHRRSGAGLARTFQDVRLFPRLTVRENLEVAGLAAGLSSRVARERVTNALEAAGLGLLVHRRANEIPYGSGHRLAVVRALVSEPAFIFLDEPAAGLNEEESDDLLDMVRAMAAEQSCGVLVVEHDMRFVMGLCDRIHVLDQGRTISVGPPDAIRVDQEVVRAYLGTGPGRESVARG